ncbi:MAG: hypothetical protein LBE91_10820 [Tannerella sp.]|jgi:hypothetical protein|nr:hypothetical protein [Tannerella sp.]
MKYIKTISFIFIVCVIISCIKNKNTGNAKKIIVEWVGETILFPQNLDCMMRDSMMQCPETDNSNYKILLYIDSLGCTSCRTKLPKWRKLIVESDTLFENKPDFLFFFQPKINGIKELKILLKSNGFDYPVFVDRENKIMQLNSFPKEPEYQCFLLDKNNKVVIVGNPIYNPAIWELYKKIIRENGNADER